MKSLSIPLVALGIGALSAPVAEAETFQLRIASGHPDVNTYVNLMTTFFVPEVTRRVAAETEHEISFIEGYGGAMVSVADTLEGVQSGIIDIGGMCFCFEPSNLPMQAFQVMLPFGITSPEQSVAHARAVYDRVPYMSQVFEDRFNQKLIALIADAGYNLSTDFEWSSVEDLQNVKLAGAGLNLKWLEYAGAVPVQSSLVDAYTSLQTGVYDGWIMFPSGVVNFKLYEVAPYYAEIGFGSISWLGLTMNQNRFDSLPAEVQDIIVEVGREFETLTGERNEADYPAQIAQLEELGATVWQVPDDVRKAWAQSLADWPQIMADDLDSRGLPGTEVLKIALEEAEALGYDWPVRYEID